MSIMVQTPAAAGRIRLRHDLVFAQVPGGALVRHSDGGFVLRGSSTYQWLATLAPFLDGSRSASELTHGLDETRSKMVDDLLSVLHDKNAVVELLGEPADPEGPLADFRPQIAYLDHYGGDGVAGFMRFRTAHVTVEGQGTVAELVRRNLLRNGLQRIAAPDERAEDDVAALRIVVDATGEYTTIGAAVVDGVTPVYPVTRVADRMILGPVTGDSHTAGWMTAMSRLASNDETGDHAQVWRALADPSFARAAKPLSDVHAGLVGTIVAYDAFRYLTGALPAEADGAVVILDLVTSDTTREEILPRPRGAKLRAPAFEEIAGWSQVRDRADRERDADPEELQRYLKLVGEHAGVVSAFTDEEIDQSPVKIARAVTHNRSGARHEVLGFSLDNLGDARRRAMESAVLDYVSDVGPGEDRFHAHGRRIESARIGHWAGLSHADAEADQVVPGTTLDSERVLVPAAAVFARHDVNALGVFERTSAGEGAGRSLAEAVAQGLLSAWAYRAVHALARGGIVHEIDLAALAPSSRYLLGAAESSGLAPTMHELPAAGGAVTVLARDRRGAGAAVGSGWTVDAAVRDAMLRLIGRAAVPEGAPGADQLLIPDLDLSALSTAEAPARAPGAHVPPPGETVIVDTTTEDVRSTSALFTVRVLLPAEAND